MVEHVPTPYPVRHPDGVIIDELNLAKWLPERVFTVADVQAARVAVPRSSVEDRFLQAVQNMITDSERQAGEVRHPKAVHGRALFDDLNEQCGRNLAAWVEELAEKPENLEPRRSLDRDMPGRAESVPPYVLPPLLVAIRNELERWMAGSDWNSLMRVARVEVDGRQQWGFGITERRHFSGDGPTALVLLDATADAEILARLFDVSVRIVPADLVPPPHTRHIYHPNRFNKTSLEARHGRDLGRATARVTYLLREVNPGGTKRVGLITYQSVVEQMGQTLGIPEEQRGYFWAERGSNLKEGCDILLIVGTPTLPPDEVARLARALYRDDPTPIDETSAKEGEDEDGQRRYQDPRMRHLDEYLTNAELTQVAHRNRPLRTDGRIVITICQGEIDFLPVTETVYAFPQLDETGAPKQDTRAERLEEAYQAMRAREEESTVRTLARAAHVGQNFASSWLRQRRAEEEAASEREMRRAG